MQRYRTAYSPEFRRQMVGRDLDARPMEEAPGGRRLRVSD